MPALLIVGAEGYIGSEVYRQALERGVEALGTTRRVTAHLMHLDLLHPRCVWPLAGATILAAGVADYRQCEGNAAAWRANVDGNIAVAKAMIARGSFIVFLSSVAAEWAGHSAYGRAKQMVELFLHAACEPAIVRMERVTAQTLQTTASAILNIALDKAPGVHRIGLC